MRGDGGRDRVARSEYPTESIPEYSDTGSFQLIKESTNSQVRRHDGNSCYPKHDYGGTDASDLSCTARNPS